MERVRIRELIVGARIADALVYTVGIAGVAAGGLLFRQGEPAFAVVAWLLTFVAGASLRLASWATRAIAEQLERSRRMEEDLARLGATPQDRPRREEPDGPPDPYRRWGGWH